MRSLIPWGLALGALMLTYVGCSETAADDDDHTTTPAGTTTTGTGAGSTTSSSTTSSGGTGGTGPLTCSGPYTNIEGECDLLAQDCPDGEWCTVPVLVDPPTSQCVTHMGGLKPAGDPCEYATDCSLGLNCVDGRCSAVCCQATNEPCGEGSCDIHVSFSATYWAMFCSYAQACDLFAQSCPQTPEPMDCHVQDQQQGLAVCDERSGQWAGEGGPCEYRNDCGDSQRCNRQPPDVDPDAGVQGRCRYHCKVNTWPTDPVGQGGCPGGQHCVNLGWPAFPDLGLCVLD